MIHLYCNHFLDGASTEIYVDTFEVPITEYQTFNGNINTHLYGYFDKNSFYNRCAQALPGYYGLIFVQHENVVSELKKTLICAEY